MADAPAMNELLGADAPTNWGKWGPDDELGALNYLDAKEVLRGVQHIRSGDVFTLQIQMGRTDGPGDPLWPGCGAFPGSGCAATTSPMTA